MSDRKQILIILIVNIVFLFLSIGFAAFSSTLRIESFITITPQQDNFKIKLSKVSSSVLDGSNNLVSPTIGDGEAAIINNNGTPTISNLNANFTSSGQKVVYEFYAINQTPYDAYLTNITYLDIDNKTITKECVSKGASEGLVSLACEGINLKIQIGETVVTSTTQVSDHVLAKNEYEKIVVTIEYNGNLIDGSMDITFGNIELLYSTAGSTVDGEETATDICSLTNDIDLNNEYDLGDEITCKDEAFYVLKSTDSTITMLAKNNLDLSTNLQNGTPGTINFAKTNYWYDGTNYIIDTDYINQGRSYWYVYGDYKDENNQYLNLIYPHVSSYQSNLREKYNMTTAQATLMSYEQATDLGCDGPNRTCEGAKSWVYSSSYWLGSVGGQASAWSVASHGFFGYYECEGCFGVRPVVTISTAEVSK